MDKPKSPPPHATASAAVNNRSLENLKSLLMKCAIASTPAKKSLTPHQKAFIEKRIEQIFPDVHTPDHPPYAWMIENAIRQLNEECGSSEESISKFILEEYKDVPFSHASLLRHHLKKLSESDDLVRSCNGCTYSIGKSRNLPNSTSKPNLRFTNTTSVSRVHSSSPSPSCSSSSGYESSSTNSSSECFVPNRKRRRNTKGKKIKRKMSQNARGIKIRTNHDSGWARGRGRRRGQGRDLDSNENTKMEVYVDHQLEGEAMEIKYTTIGDDVAGENIKGNRNQDSVDVDEERIEPLRHETLVGCGDNDSMQPRRKKVTSGQGSKNVGPHKRSVCSMPTPQRGKGRGRPRKRDMQMEEYGNNLVKMEERDDMDMLDQLIEEVYMEIKGETEIQRDQLRGDERECLEIRDHCAKGMQCELNLQRTDEEKYEVFDLEPLERERHVDDNLEEGVGSGTHVVNEDQFQLHPGQTPELALVPQELQRQESNEIEQQVQPEWVEMEIIGHIDVCEGERCRIENAFEVIEEQNRKRMMEEELGHCYDELEEIENLNKNNEDQDQQIEELTMVFLEQAANVADHDQTIVGIEMYGINNGEPLELEYKSTDDDQKLLEEDRVMYADEPLELEHKITDDDQKLLDEDRVICAEEPLELEHKSTDNDHKLVEEDRVICAEEPLELKHKSTDYDQKPLEDDRVICAEAPLDLEHKPTDNDQKLLEEDRVICAEEPLELEHKPADNDQNLLEEDRVICADEQINDRQLQLKLGETETIGGEKHIQGIEQPELILEENQPENENGEVQNQQSEDLTRSSPEQEVEKADHNQTIDKETLKTEVKSMVEPQRRQLRPRPPKFQQDKKEGQFGLSTPEKSVETNMCRKLRPRPSKNESNEAANSTARHSLQKRRM